MVSSDLSHPTEPVPAGAFLKKYPILGFNGYLEKYRSTGLSIFNEREAQLGHYSESVVTTWAINVKKVADEHSDSLTLLQFSALLAPTDIPYKLLLEAASAISEPLRTLLADEVDAEALFVFEKMLEPLRQFSLIQAGTKRNCYSTHRLLQASVSTEIFPLAQNLLVMMLIDAVTRAYPYSDLNCRPARQNLLPHMLSLITQASQAGAISDALGQVYYLAAIGLVSQCNYNQAESFLKKSLELGIFYKGDKHPDMAIYAHSLGIVYLEQGRYRDAEKLLQRAFELNKILLDDADPKIAQSLNSLAMLYSKQGKFTEADNIFREIHVFNKQFLGKTHPQVAYDLNNRAMNYSRQGRYEEAETLFHEALLLFKQLFGEVHSEVATCMNNLASVLLYKGQYSEAAVFFEGALSIYRETFGLMNLEVAGCLNNLAALYLKQNKSKEAEPFLQQAAVVYNKLYENLSHSHPELIAFLNNLATYYSAQGRFKEAESIYIEVISASSETFGISHPSTVMYLNYFATCLSKALELGQDKTLSDHPLTKKILNDLEQ